MTEKQIGDALLSKHPMMFRNAAGYGIATSPKAIHKLQGGKFLLDHGSPLRFGLQPGSSDFIGWETVEVTPDMVGKTVAIFQSIEIKTEHDRLSKVQRAWNKAVQIAGGIVQVWHYNGKEIEIIQGERII